MEAIFSVSRDLIAHITKACIQSTTYKEECYKLARFIAKIALLIAECELLVAEDSSSSFASGERLFLTMQSINAALECAKQLVSQLSHSSQGASVWPLEDAAEFQSCAVELFSAIDKLNVFLQEESIAPADVKQDVASVHQQLKYLTFTMQELESTEAEENERFQELHPFNRKKST